jgi:hypothetical protein
MVGMLRRAVSVLLMVVLVSSRSNFRTITNSRADLADPTLPRPTPVKETLTQVDWESLPASVHTAPERSRSTRGHRLHRQLDRTVTNSHTVDNIMTEARRIVHELLLCALLLVMLFMLARCHYNEQTLTLSVDSTIPRAIHDL